MVTKETRGYTKKLADMMQDCMNPQTHIAFVKSKQIKPFIDVEGRQLYALMVTWVSGLTDCICQNMSRTHVENVAQSFITINEL